MEVLVIFGCFMRLLWTSFIPASNLPRDQFSTQLEMEKPMSLNFFERLRTSIRNSVLMGVHDAVDCLGESPDKEDIQKQLIAFIGKNPDDESGKAPSTGRPRNKKLGRTLKQIQAQNGAA